MLINIEFDICFEQPYNSENKYMNHNVKFCEETNCFDIFQNNNTDNWRSFRNIFWTPIKWNILFFLHSTKLDWKSVEKQIDFLDSQIYFDVQAKIDYKDENYYFFHFDCLMTMKKTSNSQFFFWFILLKVFKVWYIQIDKYKLLFTQCQNDHWTQFKLRNWILHLQLQ